MTEHVVNLYMHEVAMHVNHNVDEFKPPFTEVTLRGGGDEPVTLTPAHISALSTCLSSIDGIFDTFLGFDVETIRCLPLALFVRVAYAVVVLIKMFFAAATPNSELGRVINKDNMKVEQYLDGLVDLFKASAAEEKSRPSAKFLMVLIMLKTWFHRQSEGKAPSFPGGLAKQGLSNGSADPVARHETENSAEVPRGTNHNGQHRDSQQGSRQQPGYGPSNTPLQLLSEVATGHPSGQPGSSNTGNYSSAPNQWQQQQQFQQYDSSVNQMQNYGSLNMGNLDPRFGIGYGMGDGLEQAMGFTLGVGDFAYFNDEAFIGNLMDSVGGGATFDA
jgi:hypothetical protein